MLEKNAVSSVALHDLLNRRWSPRAFDASRPVTREQLTALLEAARWAPSCNGDEPWRFVVCNRNTDPDAWQRAYDCLSEGNQKWVVKVPVLILSCAGSIFGHNGKPNRFGQHDVGAASLNLVLQAVALGLAAHQMGGFDADKARAAFAIPVDYTPMAMIAIGYQAEPDVLPDDIKARELASRKRKALGECFFAGDWGKPVA